jgi:PAS domain S-box-containing protein
MNDYPAREEEPTYWCSAVGAPSASPSAAPAHDACIAFRCRHDDARSMLAIDAEVERLTGCTAADFIEGRVNWAELIHADDRLNVRKVIADAVDAGRAYQLGYRIRRPGDGAARCLWEQGRGIRDDQGRLVGLSGFIGDVTDRAQEEQRLAEQSERARALLDTLPSAAYSCDAEGCITFYNDQAVTLWGRRPRLGEEDRRFCGSLRLYWPDGRLMPHEQSPMARAVREGIGCRNQEVIIERPDGSRVNALVNIDPLRDAAGRICGAVNAFIDISDWRRAQEALRASQQRLQWALQGTGGGAWDWELTNGRVWWSPEMYALWEVAPGTPMDADSVLAPVDDRDRADLRAAVEEAIAARSDLRAEFRVCLPRGGQRWMSARGRLVMSDDGEVQRLLGLTTDITERKQAEAALSASEARFRRLADAMPQLVWTANGAGVVDYYNSRAREYAGIEPAPDGSWTWRPVLHPDDREPTIDAWQTAVATGEIYQCEHRVSMSDGRMRWHLSRAVPVRDGDGRIVKWFGTATDIHDIKRAQESLREADQRKTEFVATLAHELRNPLAPIRNAVELLSLSQPLPPAASTATDIIDRQSRHLVHLVDDLLDMSRVTRGRLRLQRQSILLSVVVDNAVEAVRPHIEHKHQELIVRLPPTPVALNADPVRLTQVLVNLLDNASKYSGEGEPIMLSAELDGGEAVLRVSDRGIGISAEDLPRLFDMFAQVGDAPRQGHSGLGIGLALTSRLVEMHGGRIDATSAGPGQGSTLAVRLPLNNPAATGDGQQPPAPPAAVAASDQRASGADSAARDADNASASAQQPRILVVDDNLDIVESLAMLLEVSGYPVQTAHDGLDAVETAERERPDIVLLDIGMPGIDGYEACRRIRQGPAGEGMRIIALTGWGQDDDRRKSARAGFDGHLVKPIEPKALLELLREG